MLVLGTGWLLLSLGVLAARVVHDLERARLARVEREPERPNPLIPRRTLIRVAADAATPRELAGELARRVLDSDPGRFVARATAAADRWDRIEAIRIVARARPRLALPMLEAAVESDDEAVVAAAVVALGEIGDEAAARVLVRALAGGRFSRARIATQLDRSPGCSSELVLPLLRSADAGVRFWGASLLGRRPLAADAAGELVAATADEDAAVRAAAVEALVGCWNADARSAAEALLGDPIHFVRAHALRALATLADDDLVAEAAVLLSDSSWWVRAAAKETLAARPARAAEILARYLDDPDEFVRNGAAETLQDIGAIDELVEVARTEPAAANLLGRILRAGGMRLTAAAAARSGVEIASLARLVAST